MTLLERQVGCLGRLSRCGILGPVIKQTKPPSKVAIACIAFVLLCRWMTGTLCSSICSVCWLFVQSSISVRQQDVGAGTVERIATVPQD